MNCEACRRDNPPDGLFCGGCGARLAYLCGKCGHANQASNSFCGQCGERLAPAEDEAPAVESGELPHCDVARLARTIQISVIGAVAAARLEGGDVAQEITQALHAQLDTYI